MTDKTQRNENIVRRQVFPIPSVVAPVGTRCVKVNIPDDDEHEAIFMGAIALLTKWNSWQRDGTDNAVQASEVWKRAIYDNPMFEGCDMPVQFRQLESCILEFSIDAGLTWNIAYDGSSCVREGIVDAIQDGTISAGGQQPAEGDGTPGQCYTYHVKLDGIGRWTSPVKISQNDIITVSNVQGAWYDGVLFSAWYCGDGYSYAAGSCLGIGNVTDGGDPNPSIYHMRLVGNIATEAPAFFDLFNTTYTVIASGDAPDFFIQCNDSVLTDNQGSITFDVEICKNGGIYKMLNGNDNQANITIVPGFGVYDGTADAINGSQYGSGTSAADVEIQTSLVFSHTLNIRRIKVTFIHDARRDCPGGSNPDECGVYDGANFASPLYNYVFSTHAPDNIEHTVDSGPININKAVLYIAGFARNNTTGDGARMQLKYIEITYTGAVPF